MKKIVIFSVLVIVLVAVFLVMKPNTSNLINNEVVNEEEVLGTPGELDRVIVDEEEILDTPIVRLGEGCKIVSGCNGPIHCVGEDQPNDMITTCEYLPEYACYKEDFAICEKQPTGECGWTLTDKFNQCLETARAEM